MRYIECPEPVELAGPAVFLAGGITGCPDWQARAVAMLADLDVTVLNPRRASWPIGDPSATPTQIQWEHAALRMVDLTLFWFVGGGLVQPIALLELGAALGSPIRRIVVGADPGYPRRLDVQWQTRLSRPDTVVHDTLADTVAAARHALGYRPEPAGRLRR